jgi:hypothetical protein
MTAPFKEWTVLPHGPLTRINERIMVVVGELKMPLMVLPRRMTAVRLHSGGLAIFSAIALREPEMDELESFGRPAFLIVPSPRHRLDAPTYVERYPDITVVAPRAGVEKIEEVVPVSTSAPDFGDPTVRYVEICGDSALEVEGDDGLTLIVNDLIGDIHDEKGIGGWLLKAMGFAGDEAHVPQAQERSRATVPFLGRPAGPATHRRVAWGPDRSAPARGAAKAGCQPGLIFRRHGYNPSP